VIRQIFTNLWRKPEPLSGPLELAEERDPLDGVTLPDPRSQNSLLGWAEDHIGHYETESRRHRNEAAPLERYLEILKKELSRRSDKSGEKRTLKWSFDKDVYINGLEKLTTERLASSFGEAYNDALKNRRYKRPETIYRKAKEQLDKDMTSRVLLKVEFSNRRQKKNSHPGGLAEMVMYGDFNRVSPKSDVPKDSSMEILLEKDLTTGEVSITSVALQDESVKNRRGDHETGFALQDHGSIENAIREIDRWGRHNIPDYPKEQAFMDRAYKWAFRPASKMPSAGRRR